MQELNKIKAEIAGMARLALTMWQNTFRSFMEHDLDILARVLSDENKLNDLDKDITAKLVELGRSSKEARERSQALIFADVVGDLELIGDYCKDILERVQIKIEERLLFSDEAVKEYEVLYHKTEEALDEIVCALEKDNFSLVKAVLKKEEHIDTLVDEYRQRHNERMINGVCVPIACNMYLNMLDFTAAIYYHAKKIARQMLKAQK